MNCPYCTKHIPGITGFQEAENFQRHLNKCPKRPRSVTITQSNGSKRVKHNSFFTITDALEIRAASSQ
jgi:hypothetical protein